MLKNGSLLGGALGLLVAVLAAGCSDGEALSREQYVSKLNAMCEDFRRREEQIGEPQALADLVEKGPLIREAFEKAIADEVQNLNAPDELADQADRLIDLAGRQRDTIAELVDAAKNDDFGRVRTLAARNEELNRKAGSIARDLGADACAEG